MGLNLMLMGPVKGCTQCWSLKDWWYCDLVTLEQFNLVLHDSLISSGIVYPKKCIMVGFRLYFGLSKKNSWWIVLHRFNPFVTRTEQTDNGTNLHLNDQNLLLWPVYNIHKTSFAVNSQFVGINTKEHWSYTPVHVFQLPKLWKLWKQFLVHTDYQKGHPLLSQSHHHLLVQYGIPAIQKSISSNNFTIAIFTKIFKKTT